MMQIQKQSLNGISIMQSLVQMDEIVKAIRNKVPANKLQKLSGLTDIQKEWIEKKELELDFSNKIRLHYYLGKVLDSDLEIQNCFKEIERTILGATLQTFEVTMKN